MAESAEFAEVTGTHREGIVDHGSGRETRCARSRGAEDTAALPSAQGWASVTRRQRTASAANRSLHGIVSDDSTAGSGGLPRRDLAARPPCRASRAGDRRNPCADHEACTDGLGLRPNELRADTNAADGSSQRFARGGDNVEAWPELLRRPADPRPYDPRAKQLRARYNAR
jgi:hypothetical protein